MEMEKVEREEFKSVQDFSPQNIIESHLGDQTFQYDLQSFDSSIEPEPEYNTNFRLESSQDANTAFNYQRKSLISPLYHTQVA